MITKTAEAFGQQQELTPIAWMINGDLGRQSGKQLGVGTVLDRV